MHQWLQRGSASKVSCEGTVSLLLCSRHHELRLHVLAPTPMACCQSLNKRDRATQIFSPRGAQLAPPQCNMLVLADVPGCTWLMLH